MSAPSIPPSDAALFVASKTHEIVGDVAMTFVVAMTAAAITGHLIDRTREQMHATLDQVFDVALAKVLEATETRQWPAATSSTPRSSAPDRARRVHPRGRGRNG